MLLFTCKTTTNITSDVWCNSNPRTSGYKVTTQNHEEGLRSNEIEGNPPT